VLDPAVLVLGDDGKAPVELEVDVEEDPEEFDVGVVFDGLEGVDTPLVWTVPDTLPFPLPVGVAARCPLTPQPASSVPPKRMSDPKARCFFIMMGFLRFLSQSCHIYNVWAWMPVTEYGRPGFGRRFP
jgi:hypothetical protein